MKSCGPRGLGVVSFIILLMSGACTRPAEEPRPGLLMLEFELIDEMRDLYPDYQPASELRRLKQIGAQLRAEFEKNNFYRMLDSTRTAEAIKPVRDNYNYLHDCNGCEVDLARGLGAERVLTGWVQKVSNLILNINIEIKDTESGNTVVRKSVDIRGNTDISWQRGIAFIIRDMLEKRQGGK